MFLSVEWAKRWLPVVFLFMSLFLPWWTLFATSLTKYYSGDDYFWASLDLSFPWGDCVNFSGLSSSWISGSYFVPVSQIPYLCSVSALVLVAGLCGLSGKNRTRTLGGPLGIAGVVSYLVLVFNKSNMSRQLGWNPYFGMARWTNAQRTIYTRIWFLSIGFYLAMAGSLMLLLPLFRTLLERLRKRL